MTPDIALSPNIAFWPHAAEHLPNDKQAARTAVENLEALARDGDLRARPTASGA